jgi:hypothetical protein
MINTHSATEKELQNLIAHATHHRFTANKAEGELSIAASESYEQRTTRATI